MEAKLEFKKKIKGTQKIVPLIVGSAEEVIEGKYNNGKFYPVVEDKTLSKEFSPKIGKIYLDVSTDKQYKWDGQQYKEVNDNNVYTKNETYNKEETNNLVGNAKNAIKVTYDELVTLRNNSQLVPGRFYRITDYENNSLVNFNGLTTHPFDIILLALTENKLAEEGWAAMHENIYDVTFSDGVTKKCYLYPTGGILGNVVDVETLLGYDSIDMSSEIIINEESKTAQFLEGVLESTDLTTPNLKYNYFQDENFSTWKLWYCLDNEGDRFKWTSNEEFTTIYKAYFILSSTYYASSFYNVKFIRNETGDKIINDTAYYAWSSEPFEIGGTIVSSLTVLTTTENIYLNTHIYDINGTNNLVGSGTIKEFHNNVIYRSTNKGVLYYISNCNELICKLKWKELKIIRDSSSLITDNKYRIVDYNTTSNASNTKIGGHEFDIIVTAIEKNELSEDARAAITERYVYTVIFTDGIVKKCYLGYNGNTSTIIDKNTLLGVQLSDNVFKNTNEKNHTYIANVASSSLSRSGFLPNYFSNCNLELWKIKYCLDNDNNKFDWADNNYYQKIFNGTYWFIRAENNDINDLFAWYNEDNDSYIYTKVLDVNVGLSYFSSTGNYSYGNEIKEISGFGKGVIYNLVDEFNNDCPYDFKNIIYVFKRGFIITYSTYGLRKKRYDRNTSIDTTINGIPYYGWSKVEEIESGGVDLPNDYWFTSQQITPNSDRYVISNGVATKNNNGNMENFSSDNFDTYTFGSSYGNDLSRLKDSTVHNNKIASYTPGKLALNCIYFISNSNSGYIYNNTFDSGCHDMSFKQNTYNNYFRNSYLNFFGQGCNNNIFKNSCYNNSAGDYFADNYLGNACYNNDFGDSCYRNHFEDGCYRNTFKSSCSSNYLGNNCTFNFLGNGSSNNRFEDKCDSISLTASCCYNTIKYHCSKIVFGNNCFNNLVGNECSNINLSKNYMYYITIEGNNKYIDITSTATTSNSNKIQNITIAKGTNITTTVKTISHDTVNDDFNTTYQNANSSTVNV